MVEHSRLNRTRACFVYTSRFCGPLPTCACVSPGIWTTGLPHSQGNRPNVAPDLQLESVEEFQICLVNLRS